jgi:hypothetical protein
MNSKGLSIKSNHEPCVVKIFSFIIYLMFLIVLIELI